MAELERCPYCGGKAEIKGRKKMKGVCTVCGATGPECDFRTQAIKRWNERASSPVEENIIKETVQ